MRPLWSPVGQFYNFQDFAEFTFVLSNQQITHPSMHILKNIALRGKIFCQIFTIFCSVKIVQERFKTTWNIAVQSVKSYRYLFHRKTNYMIIKRFQPVSLFLPKLISNVYIRLSYHFHELSSKNISQENIIWQITDPTSFINILHPLRRNNICAS